MEALVSGCWARLTALQEARPRRIDGPHIAADVEYAPCGECVPGRPRRLRLSGLAQGLRVRSSLSTHGGSL